jgi:hypothetical protein
MKCPEQVAIEAKLKLVEKGIGEVGSESEHMKFLF